MIRLPDLEENVRIMAAAITDIGETAEATAEFIDQTGVESEAVLEMADRFAASGLDSTRAFTTGFLLGMFTGKDLG